MGTDLVFWALVPDDPLLGELTELKQECALSFGLRKALRSPPHLTLIPPAMPDPAELERLDELAMSLAEKETPFELVLDGASGFPMHTIFVDVHPQRSLLELEGKLLNSFRTAFPDRFHSQRRFHPHVTIAFRDLEADLYSTVFSWLNKMQIHAKWNVKTLARLVLRTDTGWVVAKWFPFKA